MYEKILVGTDGSATAAQAVRKAIELARISDAALDVVTVRGADQSEESAKQLLEPATAEARGAGLKAVNGLVRGGDPSEALVSAAEQRGSDLLVVGNKGMTGTKRFLLGSVPDKISHHAPCAVLIVQTS